MSQLNNIGQWPKIKKMAECSLTIFKNTKPEFFDKFIEDSYLERFVRNLSNTEVDNILAFRREAVCAPSLSRRFRIDYAQPPFKKSLLVGIRRQQKKYYG